LRSACRSRTDLMLENAALRHQLCVLTRARRRPRMTAADRWFWVVLHRLWRRWSEVLVLVKPETVVRWRRAGFRLYWNWLSRGGRPDGPGRRDAIGELDRLRADPALPDWLRPSSSPSAPSPPAAATAAWPTRRSCTTRRPPSGYGKYPPAIPV